MSEDQERLNKKIGTKEAEVLKPKKVKIEKVEIVTIGEGSKANDKVVCFVKHPDREDTVNISSTKYEKKKNLVVSGLWYKEDEDGLIRKGSALSILMTFLSVETIKELEGKEVDTTEDDKGYLCFKAY